jgi:Hemerythrin HHE cation binding domain
MAATEDLFTPIHKAIRSMIYDVAGRLQSNDFADVPASKPLLADLEHEFSAALSAGCVLCLVHSHAADEESGVFPDVGKWDAGLVRGFIEDHHDLTRRLEAITTLAHATLAKESPPERVRSGVALNQVANDFFRAYLDHMNREEEKLVPMMREHFTDDQIRTMRSSIMRGMPPDRLAAIFGWMFPSLNMAELTAMVGGAKASMPPEQFRFVAGIAERHLPPERWRAVRERVGF